MICPNCTSTDTTIIRTDTKIQGGIHPMLFGFCYHCTHTGKHYGLHDLAKTAFEKGE